MATIKLNQNINNLSDAEKLEIIRGIAKKIFKTCSTDKYEIQPLKLDYINVVQHFLAEVKLDEDLLIPVSCYKNPFISVDNFVKVNGVMVGQNLYLPNAEPNRFKDIYAKATTIINEQTTKMKAMPSDLDRIIYANEYLVDNTTYNKNSYGCSRGGCLLALKQGMCSGYADAMNLLMHFSGIKSYAVNAPAMNHDWNYVEVDGELYHVDACWNDTRNDRHRYLMLSDEGIQRIKPTHYNFYVQEHNRAYNNPKINVHATSKKFDSWYVHDVKGKMWYNNGLWYYYDDKRNAIIENDALGTREKIVIKSETLKIELVSLNDSVLNVKIGTTSTKIKL